VRTGRLAGRTCLIIGGTSGIGLATARRFLQEGASVVVTGQTPASSHEALEVLRDRGPFWSLTADVGDPESVEKAFQAAARLLDNRIDVMFHVAGQSGRQAGDGPLHECVLAAWDFVLQTNARGAFLTNQAAVRRMLEQPRDENGLRGTVLNVGSVIDESPAPDYFGTIAYAASKGAIRALTRAAAARYARDGIRFNLITPGLIDTPMAARAVTDPAIRSYIATKQPLSGAPGAPGDCAEAALCLCDPATHFMTGVELVVDGGWHLSEGQFSGAASRAEPDVTAAISASVQPAIAGSSDRPELPGKTGDSSPQEPHSRS
jgi:NAD(P)-dependent dehydrogenase (short-subunit alcohol dehydrogenase family)